jgi:SAM-dependent methyltransferase
VDINPEYIAAARRIAGLTGLQALLDFQVADARSLPFAAGCFAVVWCQGSLDHDEAWLDEFDRVLAAGGRIALTFAVRQPRPDTTSPLWTLDDVIELLEGRGYAVLRADDLTDRDIELGWKALDRQLTERREELGRAFGEEWIAGAHQKFGREIETMRAGRWGNGRVIAAKAPAPQQTSPLGV